MSKVLDLLDAGKYPIVNPNQGLDTCDFCCPIDTTLLKQCTHYLIVNNYDYDLDIYYVRLVTNSNKYVSNIKPQPDQIVKYFFNFFTIKYYTTDLFSITSDCIHDLPIVGYLKYL